MDIELRGTLCDNDTADIYRWFGWRDITCPGDISDAISAIPEGEDVTLLINSPGGDMTAGTEIASVLRRSGRKCTALIQGYAASAATIAMCGCGDIASEPGALICYHNPSVDASGDYRDHQRTAEEMKNAKAAILDMYERRFPGMDRQAVSALMNRDMWITPTQALDYRLIDRVVEYDGDEAPTGMRIAASAAALPIVTPTMRTAYERHMAEKRETEAQEKAAKAQWALRRGI